MTRAYYQGWIICCEERYILNSLDKEVRALFGYYPTVVKKNIIIQAPKHNNYTQYE